MTLYIVKLMAQLLYPLNLALALGIGGLIIARRRRRVGWILGVLAVGGLWLAAIPVVSHALVAALEGPYSEDDWTLLPASDAIVVLGGGIVRGGTGRLQPNLGAGVDRVWHAARLHRAGLATVVVVSGGSIPWLGDDRPEALGAAELLVELGVPRGVVVTETRSLNTRQNALYSREILRQRDLDSVLLVTAALHMPRALATFRAAGIRAHPAPTDFQRGPQGPMGGYLIHWLPDTNALTTTTAVVREGLGLGYYWLRGWL